MDGVCEAWGAVAGGVLAEPLGGEGRGEEHSEGWGVERRASLFYRGPIWVIFTSIPLGIIPSSTMSL